MKSLFDRILNEPAVIGAALLAVLDALDRGLDWRQAVILGAGVAIRAVVSPAHPRG